MSVTGANPPPNKPKETTTHDGHETTTTDAPETTATTTQAAGDDGPSWFELTFTWFMEGETEEKYRELRNGLARLIDDSSLYDAFVDDWEKTSLGLSEADDKRGDHKGFGWVIILSMALYETDENGKFVYMGTPGGGGGGGEDPGAASKGTLAC